jgi:hypothetical protein
VASPNVELDVRQPRVSVVLYGTSLVVAVGVVVLILTTVRSPVSTAFFLLCLVAILGYNTATLLSRVRAYADGTLEVRNRFSTRRLQRSEVDRVMLGRQGGFGSLLRLELLLQDGTTLNLVATETLPVSGQRRLEQLVADLRHWLAGNR